MSKRIAFINFLETVTSFIRNNATSARQWILQDRDGTIADDTDLLTKSDKLITDNDQTDDYSLALTDLDKLLNFNIGINKNLTVPPNSSVSFPIGFVAYVKRTGAGTLTFVAGAGVTITSTSGDLTDGGTNFPNGLYQESADSWILFNGDNSGGGFNGIIFVRNPTSGNSHTGNGTETILDYVLIPANTFQANDEVSFLTLETKSGTAGTSSTRLRVQTADPGVSGISGGQVIALLTGGATAVWNRMERTMNFLNSISTQIIHNAGSTAISSDRVSSTAAHASPAIDFSVNQYILCTGQLANSGDTVTLRSWSCKVARP